MSVLRKRDVSESGAVAGKVDESSWFAQNLPGLWEFIESNRFPDGSPRRAGTLTLFVDEGLFKACLSDRDADLVTFVTGTSPEACFGALEAGLQQDVLVWRRAGQKGRRK